MPLYKAEPNKEENRPFLHRRRGIPKSQDSCANLIYCIINSPRVGRRKRGTPFTALPGSLTLEAALVLPFSMMILAAFLVFFPLMSAQLSMQHALSEIGRTAAGSSVPGGGRNSETAQTDPDGIGSRIINSAVSEALLPGLVFEEMNCRFADSFVVKDGFDGVSFAGSKFDAEKGQILLKASYRMNIPFLPFDGKGIRIVQQSVHQAWVGKEADGNADETLVYVTESGSVYHTSLSCTYLKLSIQEIQAAGIEGRRNAEGACYAPCELCGGTGGTVAFITDYGNCYHYNRNCSGLKRTIRSIPLSAAGGRPLCHRCRERNGE